ncbi:NAD(P)-dependent oxidoreductase [Arenimonas soli]|uniref:dTDP-4-dehydrorhamnose reductase n=1 Tax=Arenimonas soli TaxID=2269504 RepID=A0ABQ1HAX3_9GAMM|nr:dTDP-4-dehydrorhamnose reductase [Arenimonas soli]GGA68309.1 NAD(P)-dependent oxidoreductase [Arenimonas soli]
MRLLLLGANGQVGQALRTALAPLGEVVCATRTGRLPDGGAAEPADLAAPATLAGLVARVAPDLVVNAAAYTAVDRAESERDLALRVNAEAPGVLARACAEAGIGLVHFSTDYVFDGSQSRPWRENDPTGPLGVYGQSKLAGEQAIRASGAAHKIFRLCWVYGPHGHNFLLTMLRLGRERDRLRVVDDQRGTPTSARRIAAGVAGALVAMPGASGTWHLAAEGECSWFGFADEIFRQAVDRGLLARAPALEAIPSSEFPTPARRPAYSRLDTRAFTRDTGLDLGHWREGLAEALDSLAP